VRLAPTLDARHNLAMVKDDALQRDLETLSSVRGRSLSWLPEMAVVRVDAPAGPARWFTLLRNTAHANVSHLIREGAQLRPDENTLTVGAGFIGEYSNAFFRLRQEDLPAFTAAVRGLKSEADYRALATRFAVRRTDPAFWAHTDAVQDAYRQWSPREAALFDYNRLENR